METATPNPALALAREWPMVMFVGLLTAAFGVVVVVWPSQTLVVLSVLLGIQLLLAGLFRLISAFSSEAIAPGFLGFVGILGMVAGVAVLRHPFETVAVLATILGIVWIVSGSIDIISALADSRLDDRWFFGLAGLLSLVSGIIVVSWPAPTVTVIAWVAGIYLILAGISMMYSAFRLRSLAR
ncbi:MAG: HdeD family acid-resistance protein [Acidimicrobiia bacterium]|nr:HdeD family acid-resistance protein [Acidimicrobiia bacterium]